MDVRMKIYCIPGGGTPASVFFQWVPLLKGKATVRTLDYARTFSDQSTPSVQGIAAKLYEKIQAELDEAEDYMLLSSCTGTLIAYELYQQIAAICGCCFGIFSGNCLLSEKSLSLCGKSGTYYRDLPGAV